MYDKAICLKIRRRTAALFNEKELKNVGKVHMLEALESENLEIDSFTKFDIVVVNDDGDNTTNINVRALREV